YQRNYLDAVAVDLIATTIHTLRASVAKVPQPERAEFVRVASENQWRLWSRLLPAGAHLQRRDDTRRESWRNRRGDDLGDDDIRRSLRGLVQRLNDHLGAGTRVALSRGPRPELYISLSSDVTEPDAP